MRLGRRPEIRHYTKSPMLQREFLEGLRVENGALSLSKRAARFDRLRALAVWP